MAFGLSELAPEVEQQIMADPRVQKVFQEMGIAPGQQGGLGRLGGKRQTELLFRLHQAGFTLPQGYSFTNDGHIQTEGNPWELGALVAAGILAPAAIAGLTGAGTGALAGKVATTGLPLAAKLAGAGGPGAAPGGGPGPLGGAGTTISGATQAAGQNRLNQEQLALQANQQNITGQSAFETEMMNRAKLEEQQRKDALKDVYRQSYVSNPRSSPYNVAGAPTYSAGYKSALSGLEQQGLSRLKTSPQYGTDVMPGLKPYNPLDIKNLQAATGTEPSAFERIGQVAGPAMSVFDYVSRLWPRSGQPSPTPTPSDPNTFVGPTQPSPNPDDWWDENA